MTDMIRTSGLVKRFGDVTALDGLDLAVPKGTILGLLGPNGAGKTTAVRILTTLLKPDAGSASVAGIDLLREPDRVREHIGLSGQTAAIDEHLTGNENLEMFGRLYHLGRGHARARAHMLIELFGLGDAADRPTKTYSGGMRRRLDLAAALVASPPVLFLDEPTTGLDPASRAGLWEVIRDLVREGSTLLLTTQYMEEADRLADNIIVIDHGRVIAEGTAHELKSKIGGERVEIIVENEADIPRARTAIAGIAVGDVQIDEENRRLIAAVDEGADALREALQKLHRSRVPVVDVGLRRPTLDDVFLTLTGHAAGNGSPAGEDATLEEEAR